jgi:hypothetical protein
MTTLLIALYGRILVLVALAAALSINAAALFAMT